MSEATALAIPEAPQRPEEMVPGSLTGQVEIIPVAREVALPSRDEWRALAGMANALAESGMLGKHLNGRPKAVMAVILKGRELGLPPMEALSSIYIIEGIPTLAAHLMLALIRRQGHEIWYEETSGQCATIAGQRRRLDGSLGPIERVTWTIEQAKTAGLLGKDNWKHYPDAMLRARAATALARMTFPDVLMGAVYAPEELGASVTPSGEVTSLPSAREAARAVGSIGTDAAEQSGETARQEPVRVEDGDDPAGDLHGDTVEATVVYDRPALWAEYLRFARIVGQSPKSFVSRWVAAHRKNFEQATNREIADFLDERRGYVESYLAEHPEAADNKPVGGKEPECPADPEPAPEGVDPATGEITDQQNADDTPSPASGEAQNADTERQNADGGGTEGPGNPDAEPAATPEPDTDSVSDPQDLSEGGPDLPPDVEAAAEADAERAAEVDGQGTLDAE